MKDHQNLSIWPKINNFLCKLSCFRVLIKFLAKSAQVTESKASHLELKIIKQDYAIQIFRYFLAPKKLPSSEDIPGPSSESQILVAADTQTESLQQCSNLPLDKKLVLFLSPVYTTIFLARYLFEFGPGA